MATLAVIVPILIIHTLAAHKIQFIDDVYSSNDIYLAWTVSNKTNKALPQILQYTERSNDNWRSIPIHDSTERYQNESNETVYSATLNNLAPNAIYKIRHNPTISQDSDNHVFQVRTLSNTDDWEFYLEKAAPYAVGAVGAVILAPVALEILGFGSGLK